MITDSFFIIDDVLLTIALCLATVWITIISNKLRNSIDRINELEDKMTDLVETND